MGKRENDSGEWKEKIDANAGEKIDFLMVLLNGGQDKIDNVVLKAELPQEISYEGDLRIEGESNSGDIKNGINIGSIAPDKVKTITFKGQVEEGIAKTETVLTGTALNKGLSVSDSISVVFEGGSKGVAAAGFSLMSIFKKWYYLLLIILAIILIAFFFKRFFSFSER